MSPKGTAAAFALLAAAMAGCGGPTVGNAPEHQVVNTATGSYRQISIGEPSAHVLSKFGASKLAHGSVAPLNRDAGDLDGATFSRCEVPGVPRLSSMGILRYEEVSFTLLAHDVCGFIVTEDGAATERGVAIGDPLKDAEKAYPELNCGTANEGTEYRTYPYCSGRLAPSRPGPGRNLWFGGDPINEIEMNYGKMS